MKYLNVLYSLAITFSLISCGGSDSSDTTPEPTNNQRSVNTNSPAPVTNTNVVQPSGLAPSASNTFVGEKGTLSRNGNKLFDANGEVIQLRGMSLFWSQWIGKYYNPAAVKWLKEDWNINIIRAAMGVEHDSGFLSNPEFEKQKVFTVIEAAIQEGIYVIVDWHSHEAQNHEEAAIAFFGEVAQRYGAYPNIIYETYNEPLRGDSWRNVLKPYHEAVIAEIRKHDPDNLIVCGTPTYSQDVDDVIGNEIEDDNVAYTLHYYAASHKQSLRDKAQQAIDADLLLFVTEYGTTEASGNGFLDVAESRRWWEFLDDNDISWCNWSVADKAEQSAALAPGARSTGGWNANQITRSGNLVRDELRLKN